MRRVVSNPINNAPFSSITSAMISFSRASIGPPITRRRYVGTTPRHTRTRNAIFAFSRNVTPTPDNIRQPSTI
jgi:hypothetical protein